MNLDFSDKKFENAPKIDERDFVHDTSASRWTLKNMDGFSPTHHDGLHQYQAVMVEVNYGYALGLGWPGVGPSNAAYTMKGLVRDDGLLCKPDTTRGEPGLRPVIVYRS